MYSLQSIVVIFCIVVVGYVLIRRRGDPGRRDTDDRPQGRGTAPPPGSGADRLERPPSTPAPTRDARPPEERSGDGGSEERPGTG